MAKKKKKPKNGFLHGFTSAQHTKGQLMSTAVETGKDLLVGVIAGGLAGAAIGKSSLLFGILITGAGHYTDSRLAQTFGMGMMASNGFQKSGTVSGLDGLDGVKERLLAYKDSFGEKFYLSKFLKKKDTAAASATAGFGDVQLFNYNDAMNGSLAALDDIEKQLADSALEFHGTMGGELPEVGDIRDNMGDAPEIMGDVEIMGDIDERLY